MFMPDGNILLLKLIQYVSFRRSSFSKAAPCPLPTCNTVWKNSCSPWPARVKWSTRGASVIFKRRRDWCSKSLVRRHLCVFPIYRKGGLQVHFNKYTTPSVVHVEKELYLIVNCLSFVTILLSSKTVWHILQCPHLKCPFGRPVCSVGFSSCMLALTSMFF